jgi:hypothetical protein
MRLSRNDYPTLPRLTNGSRGSTSELSSWNSKGRKLPGKIQGSFNLASEPSKHLRSGELNVNLEPGALRWTGGGIIGNSARFFVYPQAIDPYYGHADTWTSVP